MTWPLDNNVIIFHNHFQKIFHTRIPHNAISGQSVHCHKMEFLQEIRCKVYAAQMTLESKTYISLLQVAGKAKKKNLTVTSQCNSLSTVVLISYSVATIYVLWNIKIKKLSQHIPRTYSTDWQNITSKLRLQLCGFFLVFFVFFFQKKKDILHCNVISDTR